MSTLLPPQRAELDRLRGWALAVGVAALLACAVGAYFDLAQFLRAYLAAYQFFLGLGLGSMVVLMIYFLTGGAWGFLIRRFLEAAMRTLPLLALLFLPIAVGVRELYPWARYPDLKCNRLYLNEPFFWVRAALFFAAWIGLAVILNGWSQRQDQTAGVKLPRKFRLLSAPGLVAYGVTITFASVDWVMSLQPEFHSTIFGPLLASGQILTAQALAVVALAWAANRSPIREVTSLEVLNDLGNLLFTFLVIWAYLTFFQLMLIWMTNLPDEVIWYLPRSQGGWQWVAWALFLFHFVVPFFMLLMRDVKRNPRTLAQVAGLILFMQLVHDYYQVLPAFPTTSLTEHWMDFLTPLGVGGVWLAYYLWQLQRYPVLPRHDENQEEAAHLRQHDLEAAAREQEVQHG